MRVLKNAIKHCSQKNIGTQLPGTGQPVNGLFCYFALHQTALGFEWIHRHWSCASGTPSKPLRAVFQDN